MAILSRRSFVYLVILGLSLAAVMITTVGAGFSDPRAQSSPVAGFPRLAEAQATVWGPGKGAVESEPTEENGYYPRGDAGCTVVVTAADLVATLQSLGGNSACGNDDCDRDGAVETTDVDCTLGCLFGECPVPAHAPLVTEVLAESAPEIVPYSTIRVTGNNFGPEDSLVRVTINGTEAAILERPALGEVLLGMPGVEAGQAELVVWTDDLKGHRFPIRVAEPAQIGEMDTFAGVLDLVDEAVASFGALESEALENAYGEDTQDVLDALIDFAEELATLRIELDSDPAFTAELQDTLNEVFEVAGTPEVLRDILVDIEVIPEQASQVAYHDSGAGGDSTTLVVSTARNLSNTMRLVRFTMLGWGVSAGVPYVGIAAALGVAAGVIISEGASAVRAPFLRSLRFYRRLDQGSVIEVFHPEPGGLAIAEGRRLSGANLVIRTASRKFVQTPQNNHDTYVQFGLPGLDFGFCGSVEFFLRDTGIVFDGDSGIIRDNIIPRLIGFLHNPTKPFVPIEMATSGTAGCEGTATFSGHGFNGIKPLSAAARIVNAVRTEVPNFPPGTYSMELQVAGQTSEPMDGLQIGSAIEEITVNCEHRELAVPPYPEGDTTTTCRAKTRPTGIDPPPGVTFVWRPSMPSVASMAAGPDNDSATVNAVAPGTTRILSTLQFGETLMAGIVDAPEIEVKDKTGPHEVILTTSSTTMTVSPGESISLNVGASDNVFVTRTQLQVAEGANAVENPEQDSTCPLLEHCYASYTVDVLETASVDTQIGIVAVAYDSAGNSAQSNILTFEVVPAPVTETPTQTPTKTSSRTPSRSPSVAPGGGCCAINETPGCGLPACEACVCGQDSFCCSDSWDETCANMAALLCSEDCRCGSGPGDCCAVNEGPGCNAVVCEACVCDLDASCCNEVWNESCAARAVGDCGVPCNCAGDTTPTPTSTPTHTPTHTPTETPTQTPTRAATVSLDGVVVATLSWSGVEELDLMVNIYDGILVYLYPGSGYGDGLCQGTEDLQEAVSLNEEDAVAGHYSVTVTYAQSCGTSPARTVPFSVRIQYDNIDVTIDDKVVEPFKSTQVTDFFR